MKHLKKYNESRIIGDFEEDGKHLSSLKPKSILSLDEFKNMFQELIDLSDVVEFGTHNTVYTVKVQDIPHMSFEKLSEVFSTIDFCSKRLDNYVVTKRLMNNSILIMFDVGYIKKK